VQVGGPCTGWGAGAGAGWRRGHDGCLCKPGRAVGDCLHGISCGSSQRTRTNTMCPPRPRPCTPLPRLQWQHSYVTEGKTFCIYLAVDEEAIREHASHGGWVQCGAQCGAVQQHAVPRRPPLPAVGRVAPCCTPKGCDTETPTPPLLCPCP
jgi:hypothetical protein